LRQAGGKIDSIKTNELEPSKKSRRQERAQHRQSLSELKSELKQVEKALEKEGKTLASIEAKLADEETYQGLSADEIQELLTQAASQRKQTEKLEEQWLTITGELETLQSDIG
jgi:ATP-binding cassette subfamily F protein 3